MSSDSSSTPPEGSMGEITLALRKVETGERGAADEILRLVYAELRRLAAAKLAREPAGQTLQPTALVHEMWLRLGGDQQPAWRNRSHFFAAAAEAMRRILVDNARRKRARRRGGDVEKVATDSLDLEIAAPMEDDQVLALNDALDAFAVHDPRKAELLKLWCFVGLTIPEAAEVLGISERTANRDLTYAKAWLYAEMKRLKG